MNELKRRKQMQQKIGKKGPGADADFEKLFGKDIDEFLEDSDWDIESFDRMSNFSKGTAKSALGDGRLRGLESIYLQRLETSMKKTGQQKKKEKPKAKFRVMQDRFIDDPALNPDVVENAESMPSRRAGFPASANTTAMGN